MFDKLTLRLNGVEDVISENFSSVCYGYENIIIKKKIANGKWGDTDFIE